MELKKAVEIQAGFGDGAIGVVRFFQGPENYCRKTEKSLWKFGGSPLVPPASRIQNLVSFLRFRGHGVQIRGEVLEPQEENYCKITVISYVIFAFPPPLVTQHPTAPLTHTAHSTTVFLYYFSLSVEHTEPAFNTTRSAGPLKHVCTKQPILQFRSLP
jgi:hypothetical protein